MANFYGGIPGPQGKQGEQGATGPQGPQGFSIKEVRLQGQFNATSSAKNTYEIIDSENNVIGTFDIYNGAEGQLEGQTIPVITTVKDESGSTEKVYNTGYINSVLDNIQTSNVVIENDTKPVAGGAVYAFVNSELDTLTGNDIQASADNTTTITDILTTHIEADNPHKNSAPLGSEEDGTTAITLYGTRALVNTLESNIDNIIDLLCFTISEYKNKTKYNQVKEYGELVGINIENYGYYFTK